MQRTLLSSVALAALTVAAGAADLPRRTVAPIAPAPVYAAVPAFTWTGFYAGANIGFATRDHGFRFGDGAESGDLFARGDIDPFIPAAGGVGGFGLLAPVEPGVTPAEVAAIVAAAAAQNRALIAPDLDDGNWFGHNDDDLNFTAGVQLGYNMQFGSFVVGVEGDINWVGRGDRGFRGGDTGAFAFGGEFFGNAPGTVVFADSFLINDPAAELPLEIRARDAGPAGTFYNGEVHGSGRHRSEWVSTLRGRLGFAFDRFMVYGTAGFAFQDSGGTRTSTTLDRTDCRPDIIGDDIGGETLIPGGCVTTRNRYEARGRGRDSVGAAYGLGVEWAALNNISIGLEWVRADFRDSEIAFVDPVLTAARDGRATRTPVQTDAGGNPVIRPAGGAPEAVVRRTRVDDDVDMFKLKVNVRF